MSSKENISTEECSLDTSSPIPRKRSRNPSASTSSRPPSLVSQEPSIPTENCDNITVVKKAREDSLKTENIELGASNYRKHENIPESNTCMEDIPTHSCQEVNTFLKNDEKVNVKLFLLLYYVHDIYMLNLDNSVI